MNTIYIHEIIKFGKYEHMRDLQQGKIFARSLGYFQGVEIKELDKAKRYDQFEGTSELHQPEIFLKKGSGVLLVDTEDNIVGDLTSSIIGPMKFSSGNIKRTPVFCTFSIHSKLLKDYEDGKIPKLIDPRVEKFGDYVLIISDYTSFIDRVNKLFQVYATQGLKAIPKVVEYVDVEKFHGEYGVFKKPLEYSYQSEFRIAFEGLSIPGDESIVVEIGDISDISNLITYDEFREHFKIIKGNLAFDPFLPFKLQQPQII